MSSKAETKPMDQDGARELTPKLRFPEFRDAPGWAAIPLSQVLTEHGMKSDGNARVHSVSGQKGVVDQIEHLGRSFAASDTSHYSLAKQDDIIYTKSPLKEFPYGIVKRNQNPFSVIVSPLYGVFSPSNAYLSRLIDAYFESSARANAYLEPLVQKGAKNTIQVSNDRFISERLYLPVNETEQKKLANCLASLDEIIAVQGQELEVLKAYQKGLIERLFPLEGQTIPQLRFPEFREASEWNKKRIDEVAPLQRGFDLPASDLEKGNVPVVYSNGVRSFHKIGMARGPGLVTGRSGTIGALHFIEGGDYWPHNTSLWVTSFRGHHPKFVYYLYMSIGLGRFASGSGVPTLNRNDVHAFETHVPSSHLEQTRIAEVLTLQDALIAAASDKLHALRIHKNGLMQKLFPLPDQAQV